jgi:hypothetical protein
MDRFNPKIKTPLDFIGEGVDLYDKEVANRAKAGALATMRGQNPINAMRENAPTSGQDVAGEFFKKMDPQLAIPSSGQVLKPAGESFKGVEPAAGFVADMALDPTNLVPPAKVAKIAAMGALMGKAAKGVKVASAADEAAKAAHAMTKHEDFYNALKQARGMDTRINEYTHLYNPEEYAQMKTFLAPDKMSGFAVKPDGDIVSAFNAVKGGGRLDDIMKVAMQHGGRKLDAFDKKPGEVKGLPDLYSKYGFKEVKREPNWTPGGPDVVFMERAMEEAAQAAEPEKFNAIKKMFQVDGKVFPAKDAEEAMRVHNALKSKGQVSPTSTLVDLQGQKPFKSSR